MKSTFLSIMLIAATLPAGAEITLTYSKSPNEVFSSPSDAHVLTFSRLLAGADRKEPWGVASFGERFTSSVDGAVTDLGTKGASESKLGTGVLTSTMQLAQNSSYFGMWWAAGDKDNVLKFYEGGKLVGTFDTASLSSLLPETFQNYNGNGNGPSAFINFVGDAGTKWDKIELTDNNYSSKGSDNAATRVVVYNPMADGALPGTPVARVNGSGMTKWTGKPQTPDTPPAPGTPSTPGGDSGLSVVGAAPGAPAPPVTLLAAFAGVLALRQLRAKRRAE